MNNLVSAPQKVVTAILKFLAGAVRRRYHPLVVAVSGSVGKTSTRLAIATVLRKLGYVGQPNGNYNTEIGVSLAILRARTGNRSVIAWLGVFGRGLLLLFKKQFYPSVLVLEFGSDRPGDGRPLVKLARPTIGIVTNISETHLEKLVTLQGVAAEEGELVFGLPDDGWAILNRDDELVWGMRERTKAKVLSYGFSEEAEIKIINWQLIKKDNEYGTVVKIAYQGSTIPIFIPGAVGRQYAYVCAAAVAAGIAVGLNMVDITKELNEFVPAAGRMRPLAGINNSILIDDTYNSSPLACKIALQTLKQLQEAQLVKKTIAVLGDMLELGEQSQSLHQQVGEQAAKLNIDILVTVGKLAADMAKIAREINSQLVVYEMADTKQAVEFLKGILQAGDAVLIKGSQGARMEKVTKELMAEPHRAVELLVRQSAYWLMR